jgi:ribosomal protein S18 acetylase RimI-like enzyme
MPAPDGAAAARIRPLEDADLPAVAALWNASVGPRYPMSPALLRDVVVDNPSARRGDALLAVDAGDAVRGFAYATFQRLPDPALAGYHDRGHLQAVVVDPGWRRRGLGSRLAGALAGDAARGGRTTIEAGGGFFYLWPEVPTDLPDAGPFLEALGFEFDGGELHDLRGDVTGIALAERDRVALARAGLTAGHLDGRERDDLLRYLLAEFGPEWWHDLRWAMDAGMPPQRIVVLRTADGEIVGHARIHVDGDRPIGPPLFWRGDRAGVGGLGPIGISARLRGHGIGRALLVTALHDLATQSSTDVVIDATTLLGFYGPLGFRPWMTFRSASAPTERLLRAAAAASGEPS